MMTSFKSNCPVAGHSHVDFKRRRTFFTFPSPSLLDSPVSLLCGLPACFITLVSVINYGVIFYIYLRLNPSGHQLTDLLPYCVLIHIPLIL